MAVREKLLLEDGTNLAVDVIEETIADYADAGSQDDVQMAGAAS